MSVSNYSYPSCNGALCDAAEHGHVACVKKLTKAGANVNDANMNSETALVKAVGRGHGGCVKLLIKAGADVNVVCTYGSGVHEPVMLRAVNMRNPQMLGLLVGAGADVNKKIISM